MVRLIRAEKMALSGLVFARKIARMFEQNPQYWFRSATQRFSIWLKTYFVTYPPTFLIYQIKVEKKLLHVRLCRIGTPCLVSRLSSDTLVESKHCESKEDFLFDPHKFTRSVWRLPSLRETRCFPQTPSTLFTLPAQRIISLISSSSSSLLGKCSKKVLIFHDFCH